MDVAQIAWDKVCYYLAFAFRQQLVAPGPALQKEMDVLRPIPLGDDVLARGIINDVADGVFDLLAYRSAGRPASFTFR